MAPAASQFFTWTPDEAKRKARPQSAASNCGATALVNVLAALEVPIPDINAVQRAVHTNSRKHSVSVSEYLAARSVAGCTGQDIVYGCQEVASGLVESRFFAFYPHRDVDLQHWLAGWLSMGCSAIATLNMQAMSGADYWHHQMIYGVDARGVHMTNGIGLASFDEMCLGLESPSVLRIDVDDVLSCSPFDAEECDELGDEWADLHVTKQLLRLKRRFSGFRAKADHIVIPAAYCAGIAIFARKGTFAASLLQSGGELPLQSRRKTLSDKAALSSKMRLGWQARDALVATLQALGKVSGKRHRVM
jgi:hypothetical protein